MEVMAALLALILAAPGLNRVPEVLQLLKVGEKKQALSLLKEIGTHKQNHEEAKALVKLVRSPKQRKETEILEASFLALKGIGSRKVTKSVIALLKHSVLRKIVTVRVGVCRALGGSADPAAVETIIDLLRDRYDEVCAAAADAAGAYRHDKVSVRKDLFKTILDIYEANYNLKNSVKPSLRKERSRAERKWEIIEKPMERSLQLLSNLTQADPAAWRRWWNKNKHKKWPDLEN